MIKKEHDAWTLDSFSGIRNQPTYPIYLVYNPYENSANKNHKRLKVGHAKYPNEDYSRCCVLVYQLI